MLDGLLAVQVGEEVLVLRPGDFAAIPPGVPHTFDNIDPDQPPVRTVNLMVPGGFERFFTERARIGDPSDTAALTRVAEQHGITTVGPPLRVKLGLARPSSATTTAPPHPQVVPAALVGAWALRSYESHDDSGRVETPLGSGPHGTLLYTADGHVSAHVMADARPRCRAPLPYDCTHEEKIALAESYLGYAGTYTVDGDRVTHHIVVSSYPNWTGAELRRTVRLDGDVLTLSGDAEQVDGRMRVAVLTWGRDR
jgi:hypothetical protein